MIYAFGDCELDTAKFELRRGGTACPVEPQVFDLLRTLIENRDRVLTREELMGALWPDRIVSDSALSSRIKAARRAIGDSGRAQTFIRTTHGRGFRFVADLRVSNEDARDPVGRAALTQEIRYCATGDGVQIAYATTGRGPPLVKAANWMSHLEFEWESPIWQHWIAALAAHRQLVRYDERGNGLSDREVADLSFEAMVADLEAVVDALGLDRFALFGISQGCAISVEYAVRHPERVTHLVLYGGFVQGWRRRGDPAEIDRREAMSRLIQAGWGQNNPAFRQMFTSRFLPGGSSAQMAWFNELQRQTTTPETARRLHDSFGDMDVSHRLGEVTAPTLVLHARDDAEIPLAAGRAFATGIPGARFVTLESENHVLLADEPGFARLVEETNRFLLDTET